MRHSSSLLLKVTGKWNGGGGFGGSLRSAVREKTASRRWKKRKPGEEWKRTFPFRVSANFSSAFQALKIFQKFLFHLHRKLEFFAANSRVIYFYYGSTLRIIKILVRIFNVYYHCVEDLGSLSRLKMLVVSSEDGYNFRWKFRTDCFSLQKAKHLYMSFKILILLICLRRILMEAT